MISHVSGWSLLIPKRKEITKMLMRRFFFPLFLRQMYGLKGILCESLTAAVFECEMKALDGNFFFSSVNGNIHSDLVFEKCSMLWSSEKVMAKFPYRH